MTEAAKSSGISRAEWLQALTEADIAASGDKDAVTIYEFAEMLDVHRQTAWRHLEKLVKRGKATRTRKRVTTADGCRRFLVAYRLATPQRRIPRKA